MRTCGYWGVECMQELDWEESSSEKSRSGVKIVVKDV